MVVVVVVGGLVAVYLAFFNDDSPPPLTLSSGDDRRGRRDVRSTAPDGTTAPLDDGGACVRDSLAGTWTVGGGLGRRVSRAREARAAAREERRGRTHATT